MSEFNAGAINGAGDDAVGVVEPVAVVKPKRGRPFGAKTGASGNAGDAPRVNPAALDGNPGTGSVGDNSGATGNGGARARGRTGNRAEKETPLSVVDFIGILSIAQVALVQVTGAPEFILSAEQNDLLATRYAAAASHLKTNFLTKKQKDIGLAIAATGMVAYAQFQAFNQRKTNEANAAKSSPVFNEMQRAA